MRLLRCIHDFFFLLFFLCVFFRLSLSWYCLLGLLSTTLLSVLQLSCASSARRPPPLNHTLTDHICSNGIRFSITSLAPPQTRLLTPIYAERAAISLFDALTPAGNEKGGGEEGLVFPPATISAVASTLSHFARIADLHHVPRSNMMVFATEAMRRASNAPDMLQAIAAATGGLGVHVLQPSVETLFGAVMGSRSGLTNVEGGALFLDLGGGSVQMTWVDTSLDDYEIKAAMAGNSMPYGAAKLTRILQDSDPSLHTAELGQLRQSVQAAYDSLCSAFPKLQSIRDAYRQGQNASVNVYMCGGGFRGYGSMLMHSDSTQPYPIPNIGTYTVDGSAFKQVKEMTCINQDHEGKIFGMSKRRRKQFDAITTVIDAFVSVVPNIGRVTFCKGSNRDGALMMKMPRETRESNPLEVLANVPSSQRDLYDVILQKLSEALPEQLNTHKTPTILSDRGLGYIFVQELWARLGHDSSTNASFALHNAVSRDPDSPGLTHLARALLGITLASRWGLSYGPADAFLADGLQGVISRHSKEATFWAKYVGVVASTMAQIVPASPRDADQFKNSFKYVGIIFHLAH